jgi:hypothetical protein
MSPVLTAFLSVLVGMLYAGWLYLLAMVCGGIGHGWITPLKLSFVGVFAGAALVIRFVKFDSSRQGIDWILLTSAIATNFIVFTTAADEGFRYFHRSGFFGYLWLASWAAWQIPVLLMVVFGKSKPRSL